MAGVCARRDGYRRLAGDELIERYEAPLLKEPPAYAYAFCKRCGCVVPDPAPEVEVFEIAAGLLEGDLGVAPDKHIFVEHQAPWHRIADALPRFSEEELVAWRRERSTQIA
jgi:hypothetical protein